MLGHLLEIEDTPFRLTAVDGHLLERSDQLGGAIEVGDELLGGLLAAGDEPLQAGAANRAAGDLLRELLAAAGRSSTPPSD